MSLHWIKIADSAEELKATVLLGKATSISVKGNKICVAHTKEGLFAVSDKCPHNGASLSSGLCDENSQIICPLHRYPFDLKTGRATAGLALSVLTYPLKTESGGVFIGIKPKWWEM